MKVSRVSCLHDGRRRRRGARVEVRRGVAGGRAVCVCVCVCVCERSESEGVRREGGNTWHHRTFTRHRRQRAT